MYLRFVSARQKVKKKVTLCTINSYVLKMLLNSIHRQLTITSVGRYHIDGYSLSIFTNSIYSFHLQENCQLQY